MKRGKASNHLVKEWYGQKVIARLAKTLLGELEGDGIPLVCEASCPLFCSIVINKGFQ